MTRTELSAKTSPELYDLLLSTDDNDWIIKDLLRRRRVGGEAVTFAKANNHSAGSHSLSSHSPSSPHTQAAAAMRVATHHPRTGKLLNNIAKRYQYILDCGYRGEGMRDPDDVVRQMQISINTNDSTEDIVDFEPAQKFIKALERYFAGWLIDNGLDDEYPDGPLVV